MSLVLPYLKIRWPHVNNLMQCFLQPLAGMCISRLLLLNLCFAFAPLNRVILVTQHDFGREWVVLHVYNVKG